MSTKSKIDEVFTEAGMRNHPNIICFISDWATSFAITRQEKKCLKTSEALRLVKKFRALQALYNLRAKIKKIIKEIEYEEA